MTRLGSLLWRNLRVYQIYGANTDVGKTVITTALCKAARRLYRDELTGYLKPVSTGPGHEADEQCGCPSNHITKYARGVSCATLHQYDLAISPHAAAVGKKTPKDADLLSSIYSHLIKAAGSGSNSPDGWFFIETAGGVHSPGPSGTSQAELYRPLRCPVILVGDAKLGGISTTISAFEALTLRGYDVEAVLLFEDDQYGNADYLRTYFSDRHHGVSVVSVPAPPPKNESHGSEVEDAENMRRYYDEASRSDAVRDLLSYLEGRHSARVTRLESLASQGHQRIWWPFTQQKLLTPNKITAIDSAHGDFFQTLRLPAQQEKDDYPAKREEPSLSQKQEPLLQASFDGSASWWTQGLGHANSSLTLAAAYASGRYGHVMFAEAIHEPALALAETLLQGMHGRDDNNKSRLSRVFYSDDGSTGVESALKMALRAARTRYGWAVDAKLGVVGLEGAYHGDTIGAMDCADPSAYNEKVEWYEGKGVWFRPPQVICRGGKWRVDVPAEFGGEGETSYGAESLTDVFDFRVREGRGEHLLYEAHVERVLRHHLDKGRRFGALMMEPVVLGAGGMVLVDPLFQRALINVVRRSQHLFSPESTSRHDTEPDDWTGLPVIFDEVFTGLYRLGRFTASSFLGLGADVSVHAKLLTGGLVPLCATLASESVFRTFASDDKTDALLHGHSYTAHPVGCQVALESLRQMQDMESSGRWAPFQSGWANGTGASDDGVKQNAAAPATDSERGCWSIWSPQTVDWLSRHPSVDGVWALGSVLAIHLASPGGAGYTSTAAVALRDALRATNRGPAQNPWNVHSRVLGNVLYLMGSQTTGPEVVGEMEELLRRHLS
ncbi:Bifunctional dethiobiotin synthetase/7 8-diamino-pelargonic acid aminotransferase [Apiospora marii]|uniref:Bifunctional dethiobiotin synthetase/7 8-diamino-pelargonic acid aminotransferase n=1 Tax=Apiospora marii TaxID=335849 RepID=A0ABR1SIE3_9PEZI